MAKPVNTAGTMQGMAITQRVSLIDMSEIHSQATRADALSVTQQAAEIAHQGPPIDYVKLAQIRTAIFRGDYLLDARVIANTIALQAHLS